MNDFAGLNVVVTGAGGELGLAVVGQLLQRGANCHLPSRKPLDFGKIPSEARARAHIAVGVDPADEGSVKAFFADLPRVWASIHCIGAFDAKAFVDTGMEDWNKLRAANAASCFLFCREAVRGMKSSGGGRIVNVAARPALEPRTGAGLVAYTASKAACAALTEALAEEVAQDGILVNAVVPSMMNTAANRKAMPKAEFSRWPTLEEVGATILFLASPQNSVTRGALVPVYGKS